MFLKRKLLATTLTGAMMIASSGVAGAFESPQHNAQARMVAQPTENDFSSLKEGESLSLKDGVTVTREAGNLVVSSPADEERSICATSVATVLFGLGSAALFGMAAALGPGEVAIIAGIEMTAEQLGYAAGAAGSFAALEAWADSKVCS